MKPLVIGLCGGSGSGKTTLAKRIIKHFGDDAVLLSMDNYYKDNKELSFDERSQINYDHPDSFDMELFIEHLKTLKNGGSIMHPTYDFTRHLRRDEWLPLESRPVIVVDGIMLFANPDIVSLLDVKLFIDTDADVRIVRRILRDVNERGRSLESVIGQYLKTVKPMHEAFIEPRRRIADIIVPEGGYNAVAYDMIINAIMKKLPGVPHCDINRDAERDAEQISERFPELKQI